MIHPTLRFTPRFRFAARRLLAAAVGLLALNLAATATAQSFRTLRTFAPLTEGNSPYPSLVEGADGKFYGTNSVNGKNGNGTVFTINADGSGFLVLSAFPETNGGTQPRGGVVQTRDGNFYGTTYAGGFNGFGVLYRVTPAGTLTYLDDFNNGNPGASPTGTLVEGRDGLLYGTARYGGANNYGSVFTATVPDGKLATLVSIGGNLAGYYPQSDLVLAQDGNFYGTTDQGGTSNYGVFFRVTPGGTYTVLYNFAGSADGGVPYRGVVQALDGTFYGVCQSGGTYGLGTVYRVVLSGSNVTVTGLHSFNPSLAEGNTPTGALVVASDNNLYGTTSVGGLGNGGTIYRVTPSGGFTVLYTFANGTDGGNPVGGLAQGSDGRLFGTTAGQNGSLGTIFRLDLNLSKPGPIARRLLTSSAVNAGDEIQIQGDRFVGTSAVIFTAANGQTVPAAGFAVRSKTVVAAVVPEGAVTGKVAVVTAGGSSTIPDSLTVNAPPTEPPPAANRPTVSLKTKEAQAAEIGSSKGKLKFLRAGADISQPLAVRFKVKNQSTATRDVDYKLVGPAGTLPIDVNTITIPAGFSSATLKVVALADTFGDEPNETVVIKLKGSAEYTVGTQNKSVVLVVNDD